MSDACPVPTLEHADLETQPGNAFHNAMEASHSQLRKKCPLRALFLLYPQNAHGDCSLVGYGPFHYLAYTLSGYRTKPPHTPACWVAPRVGDALGLRNRLGLRCGRRALGSQHRDPRPDPGSARGSRTASLSTAKQQDSAGLRNFTCSTVPFACVDSNACSQNPEQRIRK